MGVLRILHGLLWGVPMIGLILGTGVLLTVRTRFIQVRLFGAAISKAFKQNKTKQAKGGVSGFEAFCSAVSGTVGTGNIIGVISAITVGGAGAVFWMWVSAFFGMASGFAENVLGMYYRKRTSEGFTGGAFYCIAGGMKRRRLAKFSALMCVLAALGMCAVQSNKLCATLTEAFFPSEGYAVTVTAVLTAVFTAMVISGGGKRIGRVTVKFTPVMTLLFALMSLTAIAVHYRAVPQAFAEIFGSAFTVRSAGGGVAGHTVATAVRQGLERGVFSNEAGLGSAPIAHSASSEKEPAEQGLWGILGVFLDTFVICTLTALTCLTAYGTDLPAESDTALAVGMFSCTFGSIGKIGFGVVLPMFAFTTVLAWAHYGRRAAAYCFGEKRRHTLFNVLYLTTAMLSPFVSGEGIWLIGDTLLALMAIPSLVCLIAMNGTAVRITENYLARRHGNRIKPMRSAYPDLEERCQ